MAWINAVVPAAEGEDEPISRFVLNQDTGGSIRGPGRVDLFFGQGDDGRRARRSDQAHRGALLPAAEEIACIACSKSMRDEFSIPI